MQACHDNEAEGEINCPPPADINGWNSINNQSMDNTSIWTGELGRQTVTETYLHNQQNIQQLDLTNPETYNETQTKEEK